ncbi:MAG: hypothetical protein ACTSQG_06910 [Promethearchaeota archaeon]
MTKRSIGLRGYLGEQIVKQWLKNIKYPESKGYKIIEQVIPAGFPKKGGAYLDFCIIKNDSVKAVYEVKTQDYIAGKNFPFNNALLYLWENREKIELFEIQDKTEVFKCSPDFKAYLVLLVPPNEKGMEIIKDKNLKYVLLFEEIFKEIEKRNLDLKKEILQNIIKDLEGEICSLKKPTKGKTLIEPFKKRRKLSIKNKNN